MEVCHVSLAGACGASSLGRSRIAVVRVPAAAAITTGIARTNTVRRGEAWASRRPATTGPIGADAARRVFEAAIVRPSNRSGMRMYEYAVIAESVFGNQNACSENAEASTQTLGYVRNAA